MSVLGIHTVGPACEIALFSNGHVLLERREAMTRGQDARLPGLVTDMLKDARTELSEIDRFVVITGPGSFTGIRVGVAFARGLALATDTPCIGVTTMEAALPIGQQGSAIVALPAQRRAPDITFWTQTFRTGMATGPASEMRAEDLQALLRDKPHMVYGDPAALAPHIDGAKVHTAMPTAAVAAERGISLDPQASPATPTYARAPDAALPGGAKPQGA